MYDIAIYGFNVNGIDVEKVNYVEKVNERLMVLMLKRLIAGHGPGRQRSHASAGQPGRP
jgi:hypothetical protein